VLTIALLGLVAGLAQSLAKFCLDSTIQRDIPAQVQASAFARSDTTLQLAWVIGGFIGIALPLDPARLGLGVALAALGAWTVYVLVTRDAQAEAAGVPVEPTPPAPPAPPTPPATPAASAPATSRPDTRHTTRPAGHPASSGVSGQETQPVRVWRGDVTDDESWE
jgi:cell division septation protein DedD